MKDEHLFSALNDRFIFTAPALIMREPRVVVCAAGNIKPHVAILRQHALTSQSSAAVTHLHTGCYSFTYPGGMES